MPLLRLIVLTFCVLIAFAANSVLGRMALKPSDELLIDPATYTTIRISFGAVALALIQWFRKRRESDATRQHRQPGWFSAMTLFVYAACFSFAYMRLSAAVGTLVLFAGVQLTMLSGVRLQGERLRGLEVLGAVVAFAGLVWLVSPSLTESTFPIETVLMVGSGIGWGLYSLTGRGSSDPVADTSTNFIRAVPFALVLSLIFLNIAHVTGEGLLLAAASGAITSGLGYVLWYTVLPSLTGAQAAAVQLSVPVVAGLGGVLFAGDALSAETILAGGVILAGIALTIRWRKPKRTS